MSNNGRIETGESVLVESADALEEGIVEGIYPSENGERDGGAEFVVRIERPDPRIFETVDPDLSKFDPPETVYQTVERDALTVLR